MKCNTAGCKMPGLWCISYLVVTKETNWCSGIGREQYCSRCAIEIEKTPSLALKEINANYQWNLTPEDVQWSRSTIKTVKPVTVYYPNDMLCDHKALKAIQP